MKKIISLLLVALLCLGTLTACGAKSDYEWTNEYGISYDVSKLDYANFDIAALFNENGYMEGVTGLDYVTLPEDYLSISVPAAEIALTDEEMESAINDLLTSFADVEQITEGVIQSGDMVNIDYVGSVDGVEFSGGNTQGLGTDVEAGSTEYIDDFLTQIIGHEPGDTIDVVVTFPEGYNDSTDADGNPMVLAGKEAVFVTTINYIHGESILPELTDEWVLSNMTYYGLETVQDVYDDMNDYYGGQKKYTYVQDYLLNNSTYAEKLPADLLHYVAEYMLYVQNYYAQSLGGNLEQYLQMQGYTSVENYLDSNAELILTDAHNYLLVQALAEAMEIKLDAESAAALLGSYYSQYVQTYGDNFTIMTATSSQCISQLTDSAVVVD